MISRCIESNSRFKESFRVIDTSFFLIIFEKCVKKIEFFIVVISKIHFFGILDLANDINMQK